LFVAARAAFAGPVVNINVTYSHETHGVSAGWVHRCKRACCGIQIVSAAARLMSAVVISDQIADIQRRT
jgi:hypothetical protein